jgi:hypothetical protein
MQPIELVWAQVKGAVAMQYSEDTTFKDVGVRLHEQFTKLGQEGHRVDKIYRHVDHIEDAYRIADDPLAADLLGNSGTDAEYRKLAQEVEADLALDDDESDPGDDWDSDDVDDTDGDGNDEDDAESE